MTQTFILIDGSYFIFYRYYALLNWWRHSQQETQPCLENKEFIDKFENIFINKIKEIKKKLKLKEAYLLVAKDCSRNHIWRNTLYSNYKSTRDNNGLETLGACFKHAYTNNLFQKGGCYHKILSHPGLEADDCVALFTNYITNKMPNSIIYIVASDADYIQLKTPQINIVNLKYQSIINNKTIFEDSKKSLFCKIVSGDKSDNIPPIITRCGIKTAIKYYENPELFEKLLQDNPNAKQQFELNKKLIDFNEIPENLKKDFYATCVEIM